MATFNTHHYYGDKNLGLRVCPFDPNHKVKDSKYAKHVFKCEQQFPNRAKRLSVIEEMDLSYPSMMSSFSSLKIADTSDTCSSRTTDKKPADDWWAPNGTESQTSLSPTNMDSNDWPTISDSGVDVNGSRDEIEVNDNNDNTSANNSELEDCLAQSSEVTQTGDHMNGHKEEEELNNGSHSDLETNKLVPRHVIERQIPEEDDWSHSNGGGSGDLEDWDSNVRNRPYNLVDESYDYDNLSDEQIMEMADSFVDVVVLSRMDKRQRKKFNQKLVELRKAEKSRKLKAFNELVTLRDECDPQLMGIPPEIRKPRVDIRKIFNLSKIDKSIIVSDILNVTKSTKPTETQVDPVTTPSVPAPTPEVKSSPPKLNECVETSDQKTDTEHSVCLKTFCNCCKDSLALSADNIRRMTVFCAQCSGTKFGGYFECHSCNLYGYFANSQISQHMAKHFPQNSTNV